ncbi:MAG: hypothetical protein ACM30F_05750, partial [Nitrospirota bacterium]
PSKVRDENEEHFLLQRDITSRPLRFPIFISSFLPMLNSGEHPFQVPLTNEYPCRQNGTITILY